MPISRVDTVYVRDSWDAARILCALASHDARDPDVALYNGGRRLLPEAIQQEVRRKVRFVRTKWQAFARPTVTLERGYGVCVDSARAVCALAGVNGYRSRLHFFTAYDLAEGRVRLAHVAAEILDPRWRSSDGSSGRWMWAEVTIPAAYGEHPQLAAERLGIMTTRGLGDGPVCEVDPEETAPSSVPPVQYATPEPEPETPEQAIEAVTISLDTRLGPGFAAELVHLAQSLGIDPKGAAMLLLSESDLTPHIMNSIGAVGIFQVLPMNYGVFAPLGVAAFRELSAAAQLPYAFKFWGQMIRSFGKGQTTWNGRDLYWLNFLPALFVPGAPDTHVLTRQGDRFYHGNEGLDHGGKGFITAGDLTIAEQHAVERNAALWADLEPAIDAETGGGSSGAVASIAKGVVIGGLILGVGAALAEVSPSFARMIRSWT